MFCFVSLRLQTNAQSPLCLPSDGKLLACLLVLFVLRLSSHCKIIRSKLGFVCFLAFNLTAQKNTLSSFLCVQSENKLILYLLSSCLPSRKGLNVLTTLLLSHIDYCNSLLAGLPQSLVGKLQRIQNSAARLVVCALPHVPILLEDMFTGCLSEPEFPIRLHASVSTPSPSPPLLISLTFYICTLLLDLFAPVRDTNLLKIPLYKCKTKGDRAFSYFGPSVWNSLPLHITKATTIKTFKSA